MKRTTVWRISLLLVLVAIAFASVLEARVGGGSSYSGGGGSSSGSGGGGGDSGGGEILWLLIRFLFWLTVEYPLIGIPVDIVVVILLIKWFRKSKDDEIVVAFSTSATGAGAATLADLRKFDTHFSEITFRDFCYSLYARVHHARGEGKLAQYAPYLSEWARTTLAARSKPAEVRGIVIGAMHAGRLRGIDSATVEVTVTFEANYTEVTGGKEESWYVREEWVLERKRDILSPAPEKARADHCPRCGAALQTRTDGSCNFCGVKIENGTFQWFVRSINVTSKQARGPLLTSNVPEQGTSSPTVMQPSFGTRRQEFVAAHPDFSWPAFEQHVRTTAQALQDAWTAREWEKARVYETEALFQMHRYWIDAYRRQKLRNIVDGFRVERVQAVKISRDAFYEAITVRIWAEGRDYTVDEAGNAVAGSKTQLRKWTEYWTFIRSAAPAATGGNVACPNCGAAVAVGATGVCGYCGGKITAGAFDWVLSSIEQDEAYRG